MAAVHLEGSFTRTRFTVLSYFMLAYYAYLMAVLGPLMPFLASELQLNYSEQGAHFTAFAIGIVVAGLSTDRLTHRVGRRTIFWVGGTGMAVGTLILVAGQGALVTTFASLMMGLLGAQLLVSIQAGLADAHGGFRAIALTESNIAASISASLAPLLIGELQRGGWGWRAALVVAVVLYVGAAIRFGSLPFPQPANHGAMTQEISGTLPRRFWLYWGVLFLSVAVEWSLAYWGAGFLERVVGLQAADASSAMTVFFGAVVIGRLAGSRLVRVISSRRLLLAAMLTSVIGFPLFWLGQVTSLNLIGLFIVGLGIGNQFPIGLTLAIATASNNVNTASARVSLATGIAILGVPQILGVIADSAGIRTSYTAVFGLMLAATLATVVAGLSDRRASG